MTQIPQFFCRAACVPARAAIEKIKGRNHKYEEYDRQQNRIGLFTVFG